QDGPAVAQRWYGDLVRAEPAGVEGGDRAVAEGRQHPREPALLPVAGQGTHPGPFPAHDDVADESAAHGVDRRHAAVGPGCDDQPALERDQMADGTGVDLDRSEEHTSELQS